MQNSNVTKTSQLPFGHQSVEVCIKKTVSFDDLSARFPAFSRLRDPSYYLKEEFVWQTNGHTIYDLAVFIYGKTGYGKSATINRFAGTTLMETDDVKPCTKTINSIQFINDSPGKNLHLSFNDLPGVGETLANDSQYIKWYLQALPKTSCFIYVLRADQRDYSLDISLLEDLLQLNLYKGKVLLAVNFADKIEPINRSLNRKLTDEQKRNLMDKQKLLQDLFKICSADIVFYSANTGYNFHKLTKRIVSILMEDT